VLVSIRDCKHSPKDRQWIESVYGEYLEDLSQLNTGIFPVVIEESQRNDEIFANWFSNEYAHPLVIVKGDQYVGFALVTRPRIAAAGDKPADFHLSEFFIRRPHRRVGIGRDAATLIFNRFSGEWEIVEYDRNPTAIAFWRRVVHAYTAGKYQERARNGEIRQRFKTTKTL
jgi:predicted acetyltransferase